MFDKRSFKKYIFNHFYNEFHEAISTFINDNQDNLDIDSWHVHKVDETYLDEIDIKHVFINDLPEMEIAFDVLIEAVHFIFTTKQSLYHAKHFISVVFYTKNF